MLTLSEVKAFYDLQCCLAQKIEAFKLANDCVDQSQRSIDHFFFSHLLAEEQTEKVVAFHNLGEHFQLFVIIQASQLDIYQVLKKSGAVGGVN